MKWDVTGKTLNWYEGESYFMANCHWDGCSGNIPKAAFGLGATIWTHLTGAATDDGWGGRSELEVSLCSLVTAMGREGMSLSRAGEVGSSCWILGKICVGRVSVSSHHDALLEGCAPTIVRHRKLQEICILDKKHPKNPGPCWEDALTLLQLQTVCKERRDKMGSDCEGLTWRYAPLLLVKSHQNKGCLSCPLSIAQSADSNPGSHLFSLSIRAHGRPEEESFHAYLRGPWEVWRVT